MPIDAALSSVAAHFRLPWSAYVQLLSVHNDAARGFYETEAIAGGWTIRQFRRQIDSQFYERTALSRDKEAMLLRGRQPEAGDIIKLGRFTHADAGQMNLYLNYAREHWAMDGENPPVGLILCAHRDEDVARYALAGLDNTILPAEYRTVLPAEETLVAEINKAREMLSRRRNDAGPENGQHVRERRFAYRPRPTPAVSGD